MRSPKSSMYVKDGEATGQRWDHLIARNDHLIELCIKKGGNIFPQL